MRLPGVTGGMRAKRTRTGADDMEMAGDESRVGLGVIIVMI